MTQVIEEKMKAKKLDDFLEAKPDPKDLKYLQVAVPIEFFNQVKLALKRRDLTAQEVIVAGLKLFLSESGHAEENRKNK